MTRSPVSFSNEQFNTMVAPEPREAFISVGDVTVNALVPSHKIPLHNHNYNHDKNNKSAEMILVSGIKRQP